MIGTSLLPDRVVLAAAVLLTGVLVVPDASDPVNVVKLSALLVCTLALLVLAVVRVTRDRVVRLPTGPAACAGVALLAALVLATVVAPLTSTAIWGTYGRNSGLLAYGCAALLFLLGLRVFDASGTKVLLFGVELTGLVVASYGLLQYAGVDAISWNNPFNPIIATLGNPDFAAGYLAICLPAAVWAALWDGWGVVWRALSAVTALLMLAAAVLSHAVQGPSAAAAGLVVLLVAVLLERGGRASRVGLPVLGAVVVLGGALVALGLAGTGPAARLGQRGSFQARLWYWQAALNMFKRSPVWGIGLDNYGLRWRQERPLAVVPALGGDHYSDAAHSVPLQMLAQGGIVLGLAYLAYTAVVLVCLVRGLRRTTGAARLMLGGLGGCWAAYEVQSAVSIDQVPLLVLQFALSAAVVVAAGASRLREMRLPGALVPAAGKRRSVLTPRTLTGADWAVVSVAALVALFLAFHALDPTRAGRASYAGDVAKASGNGDTALADYERAITLQPREVTYRTRLAQLYNDARQPHLALSSYERAAAVDDFDIGAVRTSGRLAAAAGDLAAAKRYFERGAWLDPNNPASVLDLTGFLLAHGGAPEAHARLEPLVVALPGQALLWAGLGDARAVTGDKSGAKAAYQRALALQPGNAEAMAGLKKL